MGFNPTVFDAGAFSGEESSSHLHPETERLPGPGRHTQGGKLEGGKWSIQRGTSLSVYLSICCSPVSVTTSLAVSNLSVSLPVCLQKFRRRVQESTQTLRELEISLRTNHIGYVCLYTCLIDLSLYDHPLPFLITCLPLCRWVREFLNEENRGLDVLVEYLSFAQYAVTWVTTSFSISHSKSILTTRSIYLFLLHTKDIWVYNKKKQLKFQLFFPDICMSIYYNKKHI